MQRAGRAGRQTSLQAEAILMVEESVFVIQNRQAKPTNAENEEELWEFDNEDAEEEGIGDGELNVGQPADANADGVLRPNRVSALQKVPKKKCEAGLRSWIEAEECRRNVADEYFDNPPRIEGQSD